MESEEPQEEVPLDVSLEEPNVPIVVEVFEPIFGAGRVLAMVFCLFLSLIYIGSLYFKKSKHARDHPKTIKGRCKRVGIACIIISCFSYPLSSKNPENIFLWFGLPTTLSLIYGSILCLFLFIILFSGPIYMSWLNKDYISYKEFKDKYKTWIFWRNYIVAPITEETVFRACMLPHLVDLFGCTGAILLAPWFFGVAHVHHIYEKYYEEKKPKLKSIIQSTMYQAGYTTLFGALSSFIFIRTNNLLAIAIAHSFCNMMGVPDISELDESENRKNIIIALVGGLVGFLILVFPLTNPELHYNDRYLLCNY